MVWEFCKRHVGAEWSSEKSWIWGRLMRTLYKRWGLWGVRDCERNILSSNSPLLLKGNAIDFLAINKFDDFQAAAFFGPLFLKHCLWKILSLSQKKSLKAFVSRSVTFTLHLGVTNSAQSLKTLKSSEVSQILVSHKNRLTFPYETIQIGVIKSLKYNKKLFYQLFRLWFAYFTKRQ